MDVIYITWHHNFYGQCCFNIVLQDDNCIMLRSRVKTNLSSNTIIRLETGKKIKRKKSSCQPIKAPTLSWSISVCILIKVELSLCLDSSKLFEWQNCSILCPFTREGVGGSAITENLCGVCYSLFLTLSDTRSPSLSPQRLPLADTLWYTSFSYPHNRSCQ